MIAASILLRDHVGDIGILTGGAQEWQACPPLSCFLPYEQKGSRI
jgi:hypothetical protein